MKSKNLLFNFHLPYKDRPNALKTHSQLCTKHSGAIFSINVPLLTRISQLRPSGANPADVKFPALVMDHKNKQFEKFSAVSDLPNDSYLLARKLGADESEQGLAENLITAN